MSILNNPDFYPTPSFVLDQMLFGVEIKGKVILEPSSGKGDIIDYLYLHGAKEVLCCEKSPELAVLSSQKGRLIGNDFLELKREQVSHLNLMVANPPFSEDEKHILHMMEIAPDGCEIVSLCNYKTYSNDYTRSRKSLASIIKTYGSIVNLGDCFSDAERKTNVEIGLVRLFKPKSQSEDEFDGYFDLSEDEEEEENGLIKFDELRSLVNRYVGAVKMFDSVVAINTEINSLISPISSELGIHFGATQRNSQYSTITRDVFKKELQKSAWKSVFNKLEMDNYVTQSVMENINKFVEQQTNVPFTLKNIYKMAHMIIGTHEGRMDKVIVEVFDWLTEHHSENRLVEGWKTNSEYVVNKKFIAPYCGVQTSFSGFPEVSWNSRGNKMNDLMKAMCHITGTKYDKKQSIEFFYSYHGEDVESELVTPETEREEGFSYLEDKQVFEIKGERVVQIKVFKFKEDPKYHYKLSSGYGKSVIRLKRFGEWYEWGFFKVRVYKKGTMHAEFKNDNDWIKFNQTAAKAKGFQLASKFTGNYRAKKKGVEIYKD